MFKIRIFLKDSLSVVYKYGFFGTFVALLFIRYIIKKKKNVIYEKQKINLPLDGINISF